MSARGDAALLVEQVARAISTVTYGSQAYWRDYVLAAQIAVFGYENVDAEVSNRARGVS